jgi:3'-phosphoadenosine 5'-phosphosulfate sulfotransferase (PAPS reductase)/FAD synthetase
MGAAIRAMHYLSSEILDKSVEQYGISAIYALFSGGHDSLTNTHVTAKHPLFAGVLHIDTGIGIPETQDFVRATCDRYGWELHIYKATEYINGKGQLEPQIYRDMVLQHGFPGPSLHQKMYDRLKALPLAHFIRDWRKINGKKIIGLSTGTRKEESRRRAAFMNKNLNNYRKDGRKIWINPIAEWSDNDCDRYIKENNLPRNPVKDNLCMSGECLCGAYAQPRELQQIEFFYPEVGARIRALEEEVKSKFPWGWDEKPPTWWAEKIKAERLEDYGQINLFNPLCTSCNLRYLPTEDDLMYK